MMTEHMDVHSPDRMPALKPRVLRFAVSPDISIQAKSSARSQAAAQPPAPPTAVRQPLFNRPAAASVAAAAPSSSIPTMGKSPNQQPASSPPYRKVRALRLFDTPTTPKTIIQKSSLNKLSAAKASAFSMASHKQQPNDSELRLFGRLRSGADSSTTSGSGCTTSGQLPTPALHQKAFATEPTSSTTAASAFPQLSGNVSNGQHDRPTALHVHNKALDSVYANVANVNPFSPNSMAMRNKKRSRTTSQRDSCTEMPAGLGGCAADAHRQSSLMASRRTVASLFSNYAPDAMPPADSEAVQAPKRLALQDSNISRYEKEFLELSRIGVGEFGYVYHCLNRLDGCDYAIKKSIKPVAGSVFEKTALNEVWAHAVLGKHDNVVRYYSAWAENNHMLIQNEYCNGGSLQNVLSSGRILGEQELRTLLQHIASGLKYIHSNDLVHMDLKAGNIFLSRMTLGTGAAGTVRSRRGSSSSGGLRASTSSAEYCDDGFEDDQAADSGAFEQVTYKIGDLGHVTSVNDPQVEEGDCRYLPVEILREDFTHLCQADIFALGITLYEAGGGGALPKNGDRWHELRNGNVPDLPRLSREFNDLIKRMTHPDPTKRPTSTSIFDDPVLYSVESKTKAQLTHELEVQRRKYDELMKKLRESQLVIKSYEMNGTPNGKKSSSSPSVTNSDRKLRSYSRKTSALSRQRTARGVGARSSTLNANGAYRDPNKVSEINFFL